MGLADNGGAYADPAQVIAKGGLANPEGKPFQVEPWLRQYRPV